MSTKKPPSYASGNHQAAAIILADPVRHLQWPEPMTEAEIEASLLVRWARTITKIEEFKLS